MLGRNSVFNYDGKPYRLLHQHANTAWAIQIDDEDAWPIALSWYEIHDLEPVVLSAEESTASWKAPTPAMLAVRDKAYELITELLVDKNLPAIFDSKSRGLMISDFAASKGASRKTIYKHLRRFWQGGQTPMALLATYHACGRNNSVTRTGHRPIAGHRVFALKEEDHGWMRKVIESHYLKGDLALMSTSYSLLLRTHYQVRDGNGDMFIAPAGERPTRRQFEHFLRKNYSMEVRQRSRKGDKKFERDLRGVLGTVLADCKGVGDFYEVDASIADVYLVARESIHQIVGKPTIYIIVDRKSRLIVGWYAGLENASWICAMQAFRSISQDKREMCERYGLVYRERDWPAHKVFPSNVLADRGEVATKASTSLASQLGVSVVNVPAKRPDWKPVVECGFKQIRSILQDGAPGYDPPENAKARQGIKYEKDACMTLDDFRKVLLAAIIRHNNRAISHYDLSVTELAHEVQPIPLELWNYDVVNRSGLLPRFEEEQVRMALLPRERAVVTKHGITFKGCIYTCEEALDHSWFSSARNKRFPVEALYEPGLVDVIYVRDPGPKGQTYRCTLTDRARKFAGYSFAEVERILNLGKSMNVDIEQNRMQIDADYHNIVDPLFKEKKAKLKKAGTVSRTARRADIKVAREDALRTERQETAARAHGTQVQGSNVVSLVNAGKHKPLATSIATSAAEVEEAIVGTASAPAKPRSASELARLMKERMMKND